MDRDVNRLFIITASTNYNEITLFASVEASTEEEALGLLQSSEEYNKDYYGVFAEEELIVWDYEAQREGKQKPVTLFHC